MRGTLLRLHGQRYTPTKPSSEAFKAYDKRLTILVAVVCLVKKKHIAFPIIKKRVIMSDIAVSLNICIIYSMSTPATYYTKLYPKQGDLTGSLEQAYNLLPAKYFDISLEALAPAQLPPWGLLLRAPTTFPISTPLKYIQTSAVTSLVSLETHPTRPENSAASTSTKMLLDSSRSSIPT